jgi:hypothetical protein
MCGCKKTIVRPKIVPRITTKVTTSSRPTITKR